MDYEENNFSSNKRKFSTSLIVTIVVAILIVAGIAWFALSKYTSGDSLGDTVSDIKSDMGSMYDDAVSRVESGVNSLTSEIKEEYNSMTSSYNDTVSRAESNVSSLEEMTPTAENVSSVPYTPPAFTMPVEGEILKDFSAKELQYSKTFGDMRLHSGIDIACKNGTAVSACGNGKVLTVEENGIYGTVLTLDIGNGLTAKYSSLADLKVKAGDKVKSGDILGSTATVPAECNDEEHLHFEVYNDGIAVSPLEELKLK